MSSKRRTPPRDATRRRPNASATPERATNPSRPAAQRPATTSRSNAPPRARGDAPRAARPVEPAEDEEYDPGVWEGRFVDTELPESPDEWVPAPPISTEPRPARGVTSTATDVEDDLDADEYDVTDDEEHAFEEDDFEEDDFDDASWDGDDSEGDDSHAETLAEDEYDDDFEDDFEDEGDAPQVMLPEDVALLEEVGVPLIAIVGRPNVGKSRLFNRMTGTRFAIVEDMPGVTRDRQYGEGVWSGRPFHVVDTGGFEPHSEDILLRQMREQAALAVEEADIIFFVVDGQSGLTPADEEIFHLLRHTEKPVFVVVNKVDGPRQDLLATEFYQLGVDAIYPISAEHGRNYEDLLDAVEHLLPPVPEAPRHDHVMRVAVLGRPNAGKSTLVNRILGEDRLLTSNIPGTTRDAINTYLEKDGRPYLFVDTAGVRRKRSISEQVEKYAVVQAFKAIDRVDVVVYIIDATEGITAQDMRLLGLIVDKGRGLVILLNKWDLVAKDHRTADVMVKQLRHDLHFAAWAPVMTVSALSGQRVHRLFPLIHAAFEQYQRRLSTSELNAYLHEATRRRQASSGGTQRLKFFYCTQVSTRPPTFMVAVNHADLIQESYKRYLSNMLRKEFSFEGTPIKIFFRGRKSGERD